MVAENGFPLKRLQTVCRDSAGRLLQLSECAYLEGCTVGAGFRVKIPWTGYIVVNEVSSFV